MKKIESLKQTAKIIEQLSEDTIATLKALTEEKVVIDFKNMDVYAQIQILVTEGYLNKDYRHYSINAKGKDLVENINYSQIDPKKYKDALTEKVIRKDVISVSYKAHNEELNTIGNETVSFEMEKDGIPIVKVNEETYANLVHRIRGQHWKQYLGEDARQLIRQKKLERFYVEDEKTNRRYLYIMPK